MRLIDADALMDIFKTLEHLGSEYADSFTNMAGNRSIELSRAEDYIENAPTVPQFGKWISVKDHLPSKLSYVLTITKGRNYCVNVWSNIAHIWWFGNDDDPVTHWMPLPEPPKKGRKR